LLGLRRATHFFYAKLYAFSPADDKDKAVKLFAIGKGAELEVHFSPYDVWIIVQNGDGSLGVHPTLFQRVNGVNFRSGSMDESTPTGCFRASYLLTCRLDVHPSGVN